MESFWEGVLENLREEVRDLAQAEDLPEEEAWKRVYRDPEAIPSGKGFPETVRVAAYLVSHRRGSP